MELTREDFALADKALRRIESNARAWRYARWIPVVFGALTCFLVAWTVWTVYGTIRHHKVETRSREATTRPVIRAELDAEVANCRLESELSSSMLIAALMGVFATYVCLNMLGWGLANWRRGPRDLLGAKLVRMFLAQKRKEMGPDSDS